MISWFHRKSSGYDYTNMPNSPNSSNVGDIDELMRNIAVGSGASFWCNSTGQGTSLYPESVVDNWFWEHGYSNAYETNCCGNGGQAYNTSAVVSSLNNRRPVLIYGCPSSTYLTTCLLGWCGGTSTCHTFVLDGYYTMTVSNTAVQVTERCRRGNVVISRSTYTYSTQNITRIHTNFGWGNSGTAYCASGYFNPAGESYVVTSKYSYLA